MQGSRFPQNRQMIKYGVRSALSGHVFACAAACALPLILPLLMRFFPALSWRINLLVADFYILSISPVLVGLSALATVFVSDPMSVGLGRFFLRFNRDPENLPSPLTVCDCFGPGYLRVVGAMLWRAVLIYSWAVVPLLVGALIPGTWEMVEISGESVIRIADGGYVFILLASVAFLYRDLVYSMTRFVLADEAYPGSMTTREVLSEARALTKGRVWELFLLNMSFFGWLMLASLTLLVGAIYVYPYLEGTMAAYYIAFEAPEPERRKDIYAGG